MIKDRLKLLRQEKNITMKQASKELQMPYTTYVNYEKGINEPNNEVLVKLAVFYGVSADYLLGNVPANKKSSPPELDDERESIVKLLRTLNDSELVELENFVDYLLHKRGR